MGIAEGVTAFTVRLEESIKRRVENARKADGNRNLNSWITKAIQEKLRRDEKRA